jgi:hypothetical protein
MKKIKIEKSLALFYFMQSLLVYLFYSFIGLFFGTGFVILVDYIYSIIFGVHFLINQLGG